jgi:hypothetical protein
MNRKFLMAGVLTFAAVLTGTELAAQEKVAAAPVQGGRGGGRGGAVALTRVPMEAKIVKDAPYSAELLIESIQTLPDGNRIVRKTTGRVYRDSQGRTRREEDREADHPAIVSVSDPVAGISFSLDPAAKVAWKTPFHTAGNIAARIPPPPPPAPADPADLERKQTLDRVMAPSMMKTPNPAVVSLGTPGHYDQKTEKLPQRNIEGVMAEGIRITRTIPAGAVGNEQPIVTTTEEWRSSELQILVLTRTSDPRTGESTYKLLNIDRSEPNQSWFEVPADFTVRDSGIHKLEAVRVPAPVRK